MQAFEKSKELKSREGIDSYLHRNCRDERIEQLFKQYLLGLDPNALKDIDTMFKFIEDHDKEICKWADENNILLAVQSIKNTEQFTVWAMYEMEKCGLGISVDYDGSGGFTLSSRENPKSNRSCSML